VSEIINGIKVPFIPINQDDIIAPKRQEAKSDEFGSIFKTELDKLRFSSHASKRLEARNIQLNEGSLNKLNEAVEKAESKGAKDSLVMLDQTAFIVNIPNRTVITAMDLSGQEDKVFTNIDTVVFA
jgi:flagellar operon protein